MQGRIFINYRRGDSSPTAGRLRDRLVQAFGEDNVFMDVESIPAGVDFVDYLKSQIASYDTFLTLIGPDWLQAKDDTGRRRLENPDDSVTMEIATALELKIKVVPVTIDGARMPTADQLPGPIKSLARRHAVAVRNDRFRSDVDSLIEKIDGRKGWLLRPLKVAGVVILIVLAAATGLYLLSLLSMNGVPPDTGQKSARPFSPRPSPDVTIAAQKEPVEVAKPRAIDQFTTEPNLDINGQDIRLPDGKISITGLDIDACAAQCDGNKSCVAFSLDRWNKECYLKNRIMTPLLDPHSIIGVKKPNSIPNMSNAPKKMATQHQQNHRFRGTPQTSKSVANVEACKAACVDDDKCIGFSFLKSFVGGARNCEIFYVSEEGFFDDPSADSGYKYQE